MREERGTIAGNIIVDEELTLWGAVGGNVTSSSMESSISAGPCMAI